MEAKVAVHVSMQCIVSLVLLDSFTATSLGADMDVAIFAMLYTARSISTGQHL